MNTAHVYRSPNEFSRFLAAQMESAMNVKLKVSEEDPLTFEVLFHEAKPDEKGLLNLHNVYDTYLKTNDLNAAVDFLNNMAEAMRYSRSVNPDKPTFNPDYIYPALRPRRDILRYNKEGYNLIHYAEVPGMDTVLLERNIGFSMLLNEEMLKSNPEWDKQSLKRRAYQNLRKHGLRQPNIQLQNPLSDHCELWVYQDHPIPVQCQLLLPDMTFGRLPDQFIAAFPNRETTLILKSREDMLTLSAAKRIVKETRMQELVNQSYHVMPYPLSRDIYWISNGCPTRIV